MCSFCVLVEVVADLGSDTFCPAFCFEVSWPHCRAHRQPALVCIQKTVKFSSELLLHSTLGASFKAYPKSVCNCVVWELGLDIRRSFENDIPTTLYRVPISHVGRVVRQQSPKQPVHGSQSNMVDYVDTGSTWTSVRQGHVMYG
eukprot:4884372-Amphidinium_carterae.3